MNFIFRWIYREQQTERRFAPRVVGFLLVAFGLVMLSASYLPEAPERWAEFQDPVTTQSAMAVCSKMRGGAYWISVGGLDVECTGADTTCALGIAEVVYERSNPARCRVGKNVGHPSYFEIYLFSALFSIVAAGLWLLTIKEDGAKWVQLVSRVLFYTASILWLGVGVWMYAVDDRSIRRWPMSQEELDEAATHQSSYPGKRD